MTVQALIRKQKQFAVRVRQHAPLDRLHKEAPVSVTALLVVSEPHTAFCVAALTARDVRSCPILHKLDGRCSAVFRIRRRVHLRHEACDHRERKHRGQYLFHYFCHIISHLHNKGCTLIIRSLYLYRYIVPENPRPFFFFFWKFFRICQTILFRELYHTRQGYAVLTYGCICKSPKEHSEKVRTGNQEKQ